MDGMYYSPNYAPSSLRADSYPIIKENMLGEEAEDSPVHQRPLATCSIHNANIYYPKAGLDSTFSTQLQQLYNNPGAVIPNLTTPPDAYLMTVRSAVPVADAVRGFYDELGVNTPYIGYVIANRVLAGEIRRNQNLKELSEEIERLEKILEGAAHVCVIDQFVQSGETLAYAGHVLSSIGIEQVTAIRGRWYHQTPDHMLINYELLTTSHRTFMHDIGVAVCK